MVTAVQPTDTIPETEAQEPDKPDRDERRIIAMRRFFARMTHGEQRLDDARLRKLSAAVHGEASAD